MIAVNRVYNKGDEDFPKYFDEPTQVKFQEDADISGEDEPRWLGGIAYCDEIICGECGGVIELDDINKLRMLAWVSISDEIMGDEKYDED